MTVAELEKLDRRGTLNAVEAGVVNALLRAATANDWQAAHAALKEITDRLEGKPREHKMVERRQISITVSDLFEITDRLGLPRLDESQAQGLIEAVVRMEDDEA